MSARLIQFVLPAAGEERLYQPRVSTDRSREESFEELAMPLFAGLYNFACWLTQNREEAEELVQETYVKALKGFGGYQPNTNFRAWMFRILRNAFLNSRTGLRALRNESLDEDESEEEPATPETPESLLLSQLESENIQAALEQLPVHYREVILLCDVEEMSYQAISEALTIPIGTVMSRLSRARKLMRKLLSPTLRGYK